MIEGGAETSTVDKAEEYEALRRPVPSFSTHL